MAGITFIASSRGTFSAASKTVALGIPAAARQGDVLLGLLAHNLADARGATPSGWTFADSRGTGADVLDVYTRMVDRGEPALAVFPFAAAANECQGELLVLRGSSPGIVRESLSTSAFTSTTAPATSGVNSQQAINLIVSVWTCSGSPVLAPPAGFTVIDSFSTALVSPRAMLIGWKLAGATGTLSFPQASASATTTGRSFTFALRDRVPAQPGALIDVVPGNLGLIAKDTRTAR